MNSPAPHTYTADHLALCCHAYVLEDSGFLPFPRLERIEIPRDEDQRGMLYSMAGQAAARTWARVHGFCMLPRPTFEVDWGINRFVRAVRWAEAHVTVVESRARDIDPHTHPVSRNIRDVLSSGLALADVRDFCPNVGAKIGELIEYYAQHDGDLTDALPRYPEQ